MHAYSIATSALSASNNYTRFIFNAHRPSQEKLRDNVGSETFSSAQRAWDGTGAQMPSEVVRSLIHDPITDPEDAADFMLWRKRRAQEKLERRLKERELGLFEGDSTNPQKLIQEQLEAQAPAIEEPKEEVPPQLSPSIESNPPPIEPETKQAEEVLSELVRIENVYQINETHPGDHQEYKFTFDRIVLRLWVLLVRVVGQYKAEDIQQSISKQANPAALPEFYIATIRRYLRKKHFLN